MARILIIDDDETLGQMLQDILESGGHKSQQVFDGVYALQFLGLEAPPESESAGADWMSVSNNWATEGSNGWPDLLLVDCMMPRMDGLSLVTRLSNDEQAKRIPALVLTTKAKMEEPFLQLGNVKGFMAKPPDPDLLLQSVASIFPAR